MKNKVPVVFSMDHGFVMPTGIAILSILKHSDDCEVDFFILHDTSVTEDDKTIISKTVNDGNSRDNNINFIEMGNAYENSFEARGVTHATYFRLQIPWIIKSYDKVVYCDGDVLFKKSVKSLYDISLNDCYCAGVKRYQYDGFSYKKYSSKMGLDAAEYINAGVMVMNLKMMRYDNLCTQFDALAYNKYRYFDQDIINIVCKDKIASLPFGYNVMPSMNIDDHEICVIHYAGLKPWKYFTRHWFDWWCIYMNSPFFDKDLEKTIVERPLRVRQSLKIWVKWHYPSLYHRLRDLIGELPA